MVITLKKFNNMEELIEKIEFLKKEAQEKKERAFDDDSYQYNMGQEHTFDTVIKLLYGE